MVATETGLILVRHAPTGWSGRRYCGRSDPPLEGPGHAAATRLAATLAPLLPASVRIVTSPSRRARETAAAIADAIGGATVVADDRWREVDFGAAEGRTFDELAAIEPALAARLVSGESIVDWPDGESATAFADRVAAAWWDLAGSAVETVVVSHAGPIRLAMAIASNVPTTEIELLEPASFVRLRRPRAASTP